MHGHITVGGMDVVDRLRHSLAAEARLYEGERPLTDRQLAMVMHALADHTLIQAAMAYDTSQTPWPEATSIGRFFHAVGDLLDRP
jgi:hypothetical protein